MNSIYGTLPKSLPVSLTDTTILQSMLKQSIAFAPVFQLSSSVSVTVVSTEKTTTQGPIPIKPTLSPEEYNARAKAFRDFIASLENDVEPE